MVAVALNLELIVYGVFFLGNQITDQIWHALATRARVDVQTGRFIDHFVRKKVEISLEVILLVLELVLDFVPVQFSADTLLDMAALERQEWDVEINEIRVDYRSMEKTLVCIFKIKNY